MYPHAPRGGDSLAASLYEFSRVSLRLRASPCVSPRLYEECYARSRTKTSVHAKQKHNVPQGIHMVLLDVSAQTPMFIPAHAYSAFSHAP